ncbi:MerR family transcriptional regulator [Aquibacillus kalidii]|uniref:MerR family transcriptional regulator n=1 Tax=Aquibacillus kalidii TaxID=2762597 RepID=UPI001647E5BE|nr:MerR family transcriptional regulator [Aquibacillus kalidii]
MYLVKDVAKIAGISVRTLHYYDEIGILKPKKKGQNGYRLYTNQHLERLQQIQFFKELDFPLQKIKEIMDGPSYDQYHALINQKQILQAKRDRLDSIIQSVEKTIMSLDGGVNMSNQEKFEAFSMEEIKYYRNKYADEVEEIYGTTDAYQESKQRTANYSESDWQHIKVQGDEILIGLANVMDSVPNNRIVQKLVSEYRSYINDNYYECTLEIFRGLSDLYVQDIRFTKNLNKYRPGLADFFSKAIKIYCDKRES